MNGVHLIQSRELFGPPERQAELRQVWAKNDALFPFQTHPEGRPSFAELFLMCKPRMLNVITNADIAFDVTIQLAQGIKAREAYALSRWEDGVLYDMQDSQDVWIVLGGPFDITANYTMGRPGCDNRLAHDLTQAGFLVTNPSRSIRCHHFHKVPYRSYLVSGQGVGRGAQKIDRVPPPYLRVPTCYL